MKIKYTVNFQVFAPAIKELEIEDRKVEGLEDTLRDEAIMNEIKKDLENTIAWIELFEESE